MRVATPPVAAQCGGFLPHFRIQRFSEFSMVFLPTVSFTAVFSPWILISCLLLLYLGCTYQPQRFCLGGLKQFCEDQGISLHATWLCSHTFHRRLEVSWSRARVRTEAGSLKIPQNQLICSEPMRDKKTLRVTDTTEANTKFKIHGLQTAVKDTVK